MKVWREAVGVTQELLKSKGRAHLHLEGRFVTVISHKAKLYCIDSPCYHAGGPLGEGEVRDIEDIPCIRCPWHNFIIALDTGHRIERAFTSLPTTADGVYRPPIAQTYPLQPWPDEMLGPPERKQVMQRTHRVEERVNGAIWIELPATGNEAQLAAPPSAFEAKPLRFACDKYAVDPGRGKMCLDLLSDREAAEANGGAAPAIAVPPKTEGGGGLRELLTAEPQLSRKHSAMFRPALSSDDDDELNENDEARESNGESGSGSALSPMVVSAYLASRAETAANGPRPPQPESHFSRTREPSSDDDSPPGSAHEGTEPPTSPQVSRP